MTESRRSPAADESMMVDDDCCSIFLLRFNLPVEIPCGHVFCFLCVKGVCGRGNSRCPICRRDVPARYFDNPKSISIIRPQQQQQQLSTTTKIQQKNDDDDETKNSDVEEEGQCKAVAEAASCSTTSTTINKERAQWYYQSRSGGWWLYDSRTSELLEDAYAKIADDHHHQVEVSISGFPYTIDFQRMIQYRKEDPNRSRRILRLLQQRPAVERDDDDGEQSSTTTAERELLVTKGVAGLKLAKTNKITSDS